MSEVVEKSKVDWLGRFGGFVGVCSLGGVMWHGSLMADANLVSRRQYEASELHRKEDREAEDRREKEAMIPLVSADTPQIEWPVKGAFMIELPIKNVGKGVALDVTAEWVIDDAPGVVKPIKNHDWVVRERTQPRHIMSGAIAILSTIPDDIKDLHKPNHWKVTGKIRFKSHTVDRREAVTEQKFSAWYEESTGRIKITFDDLIVVPVDWTLQSVFG